MQDTVIKYLAGLPEDASRWQKRLNKQYGNLAQVTKRIDYDIKHGVDFWELVKRDEAYSELRKAIDFDYKLDTLEAGFLKKESKANHSLPFIDFNS